MSAQVPVRLRSVVLLFAATFVVLIGTSLPGAAAPTVQRSLSLKATPSTVVAGDPVVLSGTITRSPVGTDIVVSHLDGATWTQVAAFKLANPDGTFSTTVTSPAQDGAHRYRATSPATTTLRAATSPNVTVTVLKKVAVTIAANPESPLVGESFSITGTAAPARAQSGVTLQEKAGTSWRQLKVMPVDAAGHFSFPRTRTAGTATFRVVKARDGTYAAATSNEIRVPGAAPVVGPTPPEYSEDWADLADVAATGVAVSGHRLYAGGASGTRGFVKALDVPPTGLWRYQQLIYNKGGGSPAPTVKLGVSCGEPGTGLVASDPDAVGWQVQYGTRARSSFKGSSLSSVEIVKKTIAGPSLGDTNDGTFLFTIDADETFISFSLTRVGNLREMATFKIRRADLAAAGKKITKIYASITDGRATSGSSLSPFTFQTGTLRPAENRTIGGQLIDGAGQRVISTGMTDSSPMDWYVALPPTYRANSPLVIHVPQSLTGEGDDFWTDLRMEPVTKALTEAGFMLASSTDTKDRFGNQVELDNYVALRDWVMQHFGSDRDVFLYSASMGTIAAINLTGRDGLDARATATVGFIGGFDHMWNNMSEKRPEIRAAYDFDGDPTPEELHQYTAGYDPLLSFIQSPAFEGKGFRFYTGPTDTPTPAALSETMAGIVDDAGATEAEVVIANGGHLDRSQFQGDDLVAFYTRHMSRSGPPAP
ncbi:hypothetical protein [Aeromicrobium sp.]|uniref:hypothetical protein n=1 Tax=Aeromicrobium sp. TaxID=1871063 RepID=UPI003C4ACE3F